MRIGRISVALAVVAAILGWGVLAYLVFGPTYRGVVTGVDSTGATFSAMQTRSLLEMGIAPRLAVVLTGLALGYGALVVGAILGAMGRGLGRWLMVAAVVPMVALNMISFGLAMLLPVTAIAVLATVTSFATDEPERTGHPRPGHRTTARDG